MSAAIGKSDDAINCNLIDTRGFPCEKRPKIGRAWAIDRPVPLADLTLGNPITRRFQLQLQLLLHLYLNPDRRLHLRHHSLPRSFSGSWGCARSDCLPRGPNNVNGEGMADVLLSLKHAVVHPASPTGGYYTTGGVPAHGYAPQDYGQGLGSAPPHYTQGPAMSVNVSMNMTMNMNMHPR